MDPRTILLAPLITAIIVAALTVQHTTQTSYTHAKAPQEAAANISQAPATASKQNDSVSEALKALKNRSREQQPININTVTSIVAVNDSAAGKRAASSCEMEVDDWYGNSTHVCWHGVCMPVTQDYRIVFALAADQLESSLSLLQAYNDTFAEGCILVPGYPEAVQATAEIIRGLGERQVTGCTVIEMIYEIKGLIEYVNSMEPTWMYLTRQCLEAKKHSDKLIESIISRVRAAFAETYTKLHVARGRLVEEYEWLIAEANQTMDRILEAGERTRENAERFYTWMEEWLQETQDRSQNLSRKIDEALERQRSRMAETLNEAGRRAAEAQEQLHEAIAKLNNSLESMEQEVNAWERFTENVQGNLTRLSNSLGRLQEELNRLSSRMQLNITVTLPGDKG